MVEDIAEEPSLAEQAGSQGEELRSSESQQNLNNSTLELKFVLESSGFEVVVECQANTTVQQAQHLFARKIGHKPDNFRLYYNNDELDNQEMVKDLLTGDPPHVLIVKETQVHLQTTASGASVELDKQPDISNDVDDAEDNEFSEQESTQLTLDEEEHEFKRLQVQIFTPGQPNPTVLTITIDTSHQLQKPFLGGYRNRATSVVYHHASSQTPKPPKYTPEDRKISRDTQTKYQKTTTQQTVRECATQVERPGLLLDSSEDRVVVAGSYVEAKDVEARRLWAVGIIQRHMRGWFARRLAAKLRQQRDSREQFLKEQEAAQKELTEVTRQREIRRRMQPRTADDFATLYNELEAWRLAETKEVKTSSMSPEEQQQALQVLLHKEVKLLQTIDRLKIIAAKEGKTSKEAKLLAAMSKPKRWELRNGTSALVHTPLTTRAKELQLLHRALVRTPNRLEERLDALLHVKWTVKEFECSLTREIVQLVDREADLINRGRKASTLHGLRRRLSSLFMEFIQTPEFNPEAARFKVRPQRPDEYLFSDLEPVSAAEREQVHVATQA